MAARNMVSHRHKNRHRELLVLLLGAAALASCKDFGSEPSTIDCPDPLNLNCTSCHGSSDNPAPPRDTEDASSTDLATVGAHQSHLHDGNIRLAVECEECHVVPTAVTDEGHIDGFPAELTWGALATANGATPIWDRELDTCANSYCHGATLSGGTNKEPSWTTVDGSQAACGTCHGAPPPSPHTSSGNCRMCHPDTMDENNNIDVAGGHHINGVLEVIGVACNDCHGNQENPAPPVDTQGQSDTDLVTVGAHQSHLHDSDIRLAIECEQCHVVPTAVGDPGHIDDPPAELTWGWLATTDGATPIWDRTSETCADTYCHGATLGGGTNKIPSWTTLDGSQAACGTCHGAPPPPPHTTSTDCGSCHPGTMNSSGGIDVQGGQHIDGILQVQFGACDSCHGAPPATGAHLVHYGASVAEAAYGGTEGTQQLLPSGTAYAFNCGNCHPIDLAHHANGIPNSGGGVAEVDLSPVGAPAGSLKSLNAPTATYTPGSTVYTDASGFAYTLGTCSEVYCHSAASYGTPSGVQEPGVDFPFTGYPIAYPSYQLDVSRIYQSPTWDGTSLQCDSCHGFPPRSFYPTVVAGAGDSHSYIDDIGYENLHGWSMTGDPIACATCHYSTVTDQGVRSRTPLPDEWSVYQSVPMVGFGAHVNGQPDVTFTPDLVPVIADPPLFDLSSASYDPATRTCSGVGCHLLETEAQWGAPYRWSNTYECNRCHQM
ncbi:MAG: CxxxxCH/CxxCH domain-containing protein [bacterium]